jgi:predicted DNA-binding ribbon-helix-helix protein
MKSSVVKRSVIVNGHKTSVSLEEPFWLDLRTIARAQQMTLAGLVSEIDGKGKQGNLSSKDPRVCS